MEQQTRGRESTIAWFKLAELVSRGEKEKALTLYRLLSHSFENRAYSLQVEGDLLWAFEDEAALEKYKQAAFLYKKEQKLACALAVYEHLLTLKPDYYDYLLRLVEFYARLDWPEKFNERFMVLLNLFEKKQISIERVWEAVEIVVAALRESPGSQQTSQKSEILKVLKAILAQKTPDLEVRLQQLCVGPVRRNIADDLIK